MTSHTARPFRLMTYNVHRCVGLDRRHSPERIADVITRYNPDIIALQELEVGHRRTGHVHQPRRLAEILGMNYHYHPARRRGDAQFGNAVFSKLPLDAVRSAALPAYVGMQARAALWASVTVSGLKIQVINTHLGLLHFERVRQARALCGEEWLDHPECSPHPRIICGDFNATPISPAYRLFRSGMRDAQHLGSDRVRRTWPSFMPMVRYDHIFVCPQIQVHRTLVPSSRLTSLASDHLPVIMDFQVRSRPA
ncbi:MAG TPA: endonuclease/exonuclease/phosphatase family protein [Planctomycetota bacterium]